MDPHQYLNVMQMIGFTLGTIDQLQSEHMEEGQIHADYEKISEQLIDLSNYIKHCACCPAEEKDELDDGI